MPSVFGCIPSGSRYGNVPNELVHRAGPPFLDNHYRGYQYSELQLFRASEVRPPRYSSHLPGHGSHQDCTNLVSDLRSPRSSVLQPLLETPISAIVFILQLEVMFVVWSRSKHDHNNAYLSPESKIVHCS